MYRNTASGVKITQPNAMPDARASVRAAVIGDPIDHSRSPDLHNAMAQIKSAQMHNAQAPNPIDLEYTRVQAQPHDASRLASMLRTEPGWVGLSVTMPMKKAMVPFMDSVSDRVALTGALNTVSVRRGPDGAVALVGDNTDVDGILQALVRAGFDPGRLTHESVVILGGGGTSVAAVAAVMEWEASRVIVAVRDPHKARAEMANVLEAFGPRLELCELSSLADTEIKPAVMISTLPAPGIEQWGHLAVHLASPNAFLLDVAYAGWPSELAQLWRDQGGVAIHGLAMLVHQAVEQGCRFIGFEPDEESLATLCDVVGITSDGTDTVVVG